MKQMKIALMAMFAVIMGITVTSCLGSDNDSKRTYEDFVTVSGYLGTITLKGDLSKYTYTPTNPSVLEYTNGSGYTPRAYIAYELADGEEVVEGKTNYRITIVGAADLGGKDFCDDDTLDYKNGVDDVQGHISSFTSYWGANGYITVNFRTALKSTGLNHFDMYVKEVDGSTLYIGLNQNQKFDYGSESTNVPLSFAIPSKSDLASHNPTYLTGDSIDAVIVGYNGTTEVKSKSFRIEIPGYAYN